MMPRPKATEWHWSQHLSSLVAVGYLTISKIRWSIAKRAIA